MRTTQNRSAQLARQGEATLAGSLDQLKPKLSEVLQGTGLNVARFIRMCLSSHREIPSLAQCSMPSLLDCCFKAAARGWEPGSALGMCYMIPFKDKGGNLQATFISGYKGLLDQVYNSGMIDVIRVKLVYKGDKFKVVEGSKAELIHEPDPDRVNFPDDEITRGYCIWKLKGSSEYQWDLMPKALIDITRSRSKGKNSPAWVDNYAEMAKKTVLRRATKLMPMSVMPKAFREQLHAEEAVEFGDADPAENLKDADFDVLPTDAGDDKGVRSKSEEEPLPVAAVENSEGGPEPTGDGQDGPPAAPTPSDDFPADMWDRPVLTEKGSDPGAVTDLIVLLNMRLNNQPKQMHSYFLGECDIPELLACKDELKLQRLADLLDKAEAAQRKSKK